MTRGLQFDQLKFEKRHELNVYIPIQIGNVRLAKSLGNLNRGYFIILCCEFSHRFPQTHLNTVASLVKFVVNGDNALIS